LPNAGPASAITADKVPVAKTIGPACVIDARDLVGQAGPGEHPAIDLPRIKAWESDHGRIERDDVVLFWTGWTDLTYKPFPEGNRSMLDCVVLRKSPGWPEVTREAMLYLADREIRAIGTDGVSVGNFDAHRAGLERGVVFVERLVNLARLPARGALFVFLPIYVEGGTGAPGRAVALVEHAG
jgi:kynurenine formamidase